MLLFSIFFSRSHPHSGMAPCNLIHFLLSRNLIASTAQAVKLVVTIHAELQATVEAVQDVIPRTVVAVVVALLESHSQNV